MAPSPAAAVPLGRRRSFVAALPPRAPPSVRDVIVRLVGTAESPNLCPPDFSKGSMESMSMAPEQVQAPSDDPVLFRSSPLRTGTVLFVVLLVAYGAVAALGNLVLGDPEESWWSTLLQGMIVSATVSGVYLATARSTLATWVRVSDGGLELAAQGSDPVLLAWSDIADATIRRSGLRMVLEVAPIELDRVHPVQDEDEGWPPLAETPGGPAFTADLTQVWPGPRALRRELSRRLSRQGARPPTTTAGRRVH
jgi:hypothetical protein